MTQTTFWPYEHFKWAAPLPEDVGLDEFESQHSIFDFDWNLVVWWNRGIAEAVDRLEHNRRISQLFADPLAAIRQTMIAEPDGGIALWHAIANRVPLTEVRCAEHLEMAIRHVIKVNKDVQGKPFVAYDNATGTWKTEGQKLSHTATQTVGSLIDFVISNRFAHAMNLAVDFLAELAGVAVRLPDNPYRGMSAQQRTAARQNPTPEMQAYDAAKAQQKALLDKIKPIQEMQRAITRGKYAPIKTLLRARLAADQTDWDTDMRWLVLKDGVIDLEDVERTQMISPKSFSPKHMSTMALEVGWSDALRNAGRSEWEQGVEKVLPDTEVRLYLQKRYGAALLGRPGRAGKSMVWQYGPSNTAKSTIQECVAGSRGVFAPFALVTSADALTASGVMKGSGDRFKADARGKRFALLSELRDGDVLDQAMLKNITGGETVEGTAKYANAVRYFFTATLFMASNHAPSLPVGDTAASGRIHVVPFTHRLWLQESNPVEWEAAGPEHRADPSWAARVLDSPQERAAILRWVLDGLVAFFRDGGVGDLPEAMREAKEEFSSDADPVAKLVRTMLGTEPGYDGPALIRICTDVEWSGAGLLDRDGMTISRLEQLIEYRAAELGMSGYGGMDGLSTKWMRAAKQMIDELGGKRKVATILEPEKRSTRVYSRVIDVTQQPSHTGT